MEKVFNNPNVAIQLSNSFTNITHSNANALSLTPQNQSNTLEHLNLDYFKVV